MGPDGGWKVGRRPWRGRGDRAALGRCAWASPPRRCGRTSGSNRRAAVIRTCALKCARAHAQGVPSRWLVEARGARSRVPPRPEVRAAGEGGKGAAGFLKAQSSSPARSRSRFPGAEEDVQIPRSVKRFRLETLNICVSIPFLESVAGRCLEGFKAKLYKLLLNEC